MDEKQPSATYQAVAMLSGVKQYGDALADAIRSGIKAYTPKQLEESGITKGGKVNAEGLWAYVNGLVENLIGKQNFDSKDPRWKASYAAINGVVKQFGARGITTDLLEAVIGTYINTANTYVAEKDQQTIASLPTMQGRDVTKRIAELTGQGVILGNYINSATDPTEVAGIKAGLEPRLRETVNSAIATGTIEDILKKAA